jgi:hypothetical protein
MTWLRVVAAVAGRPALWPTALRQARRLARPRWWGRPPFLPLPDPAYVRFRIVTQYGGDGDRAPVPADVLNYLSWCKACR